MRLSLRFQDCCKIVKILTVKFSMMCWTISILNQIVAILRLFINLYNYKYYLNHDSSFSIAVIINAALISWGVCSHKKSCRGYRITFRPESKIKWMSEPSGSKSCEMVHKVLPGNVCNLYCVIWITGGWFSVTEKTFNF